MASEITNYKCLACGGPLRFAGSTGKMQCDYCDSVYGVEEIEAAYAEENSKAESTSARKEAEPDEWDVVMEEMAGEGMKMYSCPSCGAQLVCEDTMAASSCPYCDNPTVVPGQFSGMMKPDFVLPFKLEKEAAKTALKKHYEGKFLLPKAFKDNNRIDEIKGVYVPFWLYDGKAAGNCRFEGTTKETHRRGKEEITITKHYNVERGGEVMFEKIPADASTKMPDDIMDSIEPYDYSELKPFTKAYLTGYLADKYDVSAEENASRAVARAKKSLHDALKEDVSGYDTVSDRSNNISVEQGKVSYAMMPVWMLTTKYNNEKYMFAMNGQTGKMVGDLPMDMTKFIITMLITFIATMGILGIFCDGMMVPIIAGVIVAAIAGAILRGQLKSVAVAVEADSYMNRNSLRINHRYDMFTHETKSVRKIEDKE